MAKEVKKNAVPKKNSTTSKKKSSRNISADKILVENFVGLQKAMTNLALKFEDLSDNISKLLEVFEISAREFIKNGGPNLSNTEKELLAKINLLIEQNKVISRGVMLSNERTKRESLSSQQNLARQIQPIQSTPSFIQQSDHQPNIDGQFKPKPL